MHTDCPIHTSDARCVESLRILSSSIQEIYICTLYTLDTHLLTSFTVIRRQESSKYNPSQTTPSMLRYFSPLSEVEDCWTTSIVQGSSRQATTTDTIHQSTIEITQWRDYCPSRIDYSPSRMPHWGTTDTKHNVKSRTSVTNRTTSFPVRQPIKWPRWHSTHHPLPS